MRSWVARVVAVVTIVVGIGAAAVPARAATTHRTGSQTGTNHAAPNQAAAKHTPTNRTYADWWI